MRRAALVLATLVFGACAALQGGGWTNPCVGNVWLIVDNRNAGDVATSLRRRAILGLSVDSLLVTRHELRKPIRAWIARGGLNVGPPASIETEHVSCDRATLILGDPLSQSYFFGADVLRSRR